MYLLKEVLTSFKTIVFGRSNLLRLSFEPQQMFSHIEYFDNELDSLEERFNVNWYPVGELNSCLQSENLVS